MARFAAGRCHVRKKGKHMRYRHKSLDIALDLLTGAAILAACSGAGFAVFKLFNLI